MHATEGAAQHGCHGGHDESLGVGVCQPAAAGDAEGAATGNNVITTAVRQPWQRPARVALAGGFLLLGVWTLQGFLPALAWAIIVALAIWPVFLRLRQVVGTKDETALLPGLVTLATGLLVIVPLALAATRLGQELHLLMDWLRLVQRDGLPAPGWLAGLPFGSMATAWWNAALNHPDGAGELLHRLDRSELLAWGRRFGLGLLHVAVLFGFLLLTLFFLLRDGDRLGGQLRRASRRAFGPSGERIGEQVVASVRGTVIGLVGVGLGEGLLLAIAYAAAGVPHPALLGALTALAAMVPFGAPVVFGAVALWLLAQGALAPAVAVLGFGMAVVFVADHFVRPVLIGGATRLPFLWVLLGILGGVEVWGLLGLFIGPAVMAVLMLLWREWASDGALSLAAR